MITEEIDAEMQRLDAADVECDRRAHTSSDCVDCGDCPACDERESRRVALLKEKVGILEARIKAVLDCPEFMGAHCIEVLTGEDDPAKVPPPDPGR